MEPNWRAGLTQDSRNKIVTKVMETLQRHTPLNGQDNMSELWKIANRFEEKIYQAASDQHDYLKRISFRMLNLETKTQNAAGGGALTSSAGTNQSSTRTLEHGTSQIPQLQSRQQVVQSSQAGVMNNALQATATGQSSSFSNLMNVSQQAPVLNLPSSLANCATGGQAASQTLHVQSSLQANQQRIAQLQHARQQQQHQQQQQQPQQQQQQPPSQQHTSQHIVSATLGPQPGTAVQQQQQPFSGQQLQQSQSMSQQQQQQQQQPQQQQQHQQQPQQQQQHLPQQHQQQQSQPPPPMQQQTQLQQQQQQQQNLLLHHRLHPQQQHQLLKQHQALQQQQPQVLLQQQPQVQGLQQQAVSVLQPLQFAQSMSGHGNTQSSQTLQQQLQAKAVLHQQQQQQQQQQQNQVQSQLPPTTGLSQVQQQQQAPGLAGLMPQSQLQHPQSQQSQSQAPSLLPTSQAQPSLLSQVQASQQSQPLQLHASQQDQAQRLAQASSVMQQSNIRGIREGSAIGSSELIQQMGQVGGIDQADIVWSKMQTLKEKHLDDMKELHNLLTSSSRQQMPQEQLQKLNYYKTVLERMMPYLLATKGALPKQFKQDKVDAFEKQIVSIMETFKRGRQVPGQEQSQQQSNPTLAQAQTVQQTQQAPQNLQSDGKTMQVPQITSPLSAPSDLQPSSATNNSFPFLQSNVSSIQHAMGLTTQPTSLNSRASAGTNSLHQNNIASFAQSSVNPLQMNIPSVQQQQDQHFHQNRLLKDQEQSKQLQVRQLQQHQQQIQKQQAQLLQAQQSQLQPLSADATTDNKMAKQAALMKQILNQSHQQRTILQQQQQQKGPSLQAAASPQMSPAQLSPPTDLQNIASPAFLIPKVGTPLQSSTPPFMAPSPSPVMEDSEMKPCTSSITVVAPSLGGQVSHPAVATPSGPSAAISTPGLSVSPLLGDYMSSPQIANLQDRAQIYTTGSTDERQTATEPPMKRLARTISNMPPQALESAVADMNVLVNLADKLGGSAPGAQSRAAVGEDLSQVTKCRTQARVLSSPDGGAIAKKVKRQVESLALSLISSDGSVVNSIQKINHTDLDTESTATLQIKYSKFEKDVFEEMNHINVRLIGTRVEIDPEGNNEAAADGKDGIAVRCIYTPIAVKQNPKSPLHIGFPSLRLLIPPQYPHCSPIVREDESAPSSNNPLACEAWDGFKRAAQCLPPPVLLGDMVKAWDSSAYNAILGIAIRQGGGSFSSRYGNWINCVYP